MGSNIKERPILFNAAMVKAILSGQKTQTRRVAVPMCNPTPSNEHRSYSLRNGRICASIDHQDRSAAAPAKVTTWGAEIIDIDWVEIRVGSGKNGEGNPYHCPYGLPGERLWVKETFYYDLMPWSEGGPIKDIPFEDVDQQSIYYRADGECCDQIPECACAEVGEPRWRSSMMMARSFSRILLEVTDVRVERIKDITSKDILAEGAVDRPHEVDGLGRCPVSAFDGHVYPDLLSLWSSGWDSINAKRGYEFASNPWVWVVEFKRLEPEDLRVREMPEVSHA